jgi:hypothetical protein
VATAQGLGALVRGHPPSSGAGLPQPRSFTSPRLGPPAAPHPHRAARLPSAPLARVRQFQTARWRRPGAGPASSVIAIGQGRNTTYFRALVGRAGGPLRTRARYPGSPMCCFGGPGFTEPRLGATVAPFPAPRATQSADGIGRRRGDTIGARCRFPVRSVAAGKSGAADIIDRQRYQRDIQSDMDFRRRERRDVPDRNRGCELTE